MGQRGTRKISRYSFPHLSAILGGTGFRSPCKIPGAWDFPLLLTKQETPRLWLHNRGIFHMLGLFSLSLAPPNLAAFAASKVIPPAL